MKEFKDLIGNKVKLTDERLKHILSRHPEISANVNDFSNTLKKPDVIIKSRIDKNIILYHKKYKDYYLVIVVNKAEKFIITAYLSYKVKRGDMKWKKN